MRSCLAPLAVVLACVLYFVLAVGYGIYQRVPWPHYLVAGVACAWSVVWAVRSRRRLLPIAAAVVCLVIAGGFVWYTLDYSSYDTTARSPLVGERLDGLTTFALPSHDGEALPVLRSGARATLLVLYRGFW